TPRSGNSWPGLSLSAACKTLRACSPNIKIRAAALDSKTTNIHILPKKKLSQPSFLAVYFWHHTVYSTISSGNNAPNHNQCSFLPVELRGVFSHACLCG